MVHGLDNQGCELDCPHSKNQDGEVFKLKYISAGPLATPELSVEQAFNEIIHFAQVSKNGALYAKSAVSESDTDRFDTLCAKLIKYEEISDRIEYEIATFLNAVSADEISESTSVKIKAMYKIVGELESPGDSGATISRILSRKNIHNKEFDATTIRKLNTMADAVLDAYDEMITNLMAAHTGKLASITNAYNIEERLNNLRNNYRDAMIEGIENGSTNYQTSVYFMDIINQFERMGDFMINVSQDLEKVFSRK